MIRLTHSPLLQTIFQMVEMSPNKIALIEDGYEISYFLLRKNILCAANFLCMLGLCQGDIIALAARKEFKFIYVYFAAQLLGIRSVIMDFSCNEERKSLIMSSTKPKFIFGMKCDGTKSIRYEEVKLTKELSYIENDISSDDIAEIMFTTGTTGTPKGVQLTHQNIFSSANNINSYIGNGSDEVELIGLPLCHSFGLGRLRCSLMKGATTVLISNFANIKLMFQYIEKYGVTIFGMVPSVWAYIRKFSGTRIGKYAEQIRFIEIGSAAMSIEQKEELLRLFPTTHICMHYGLTEASRSTFMELHNYKDKLSSIGKESSRLVEVAIFDSEGKQKPLTEEGEICVKGNIVMKGYLSSSQNVSTFWGDYFRTGDVGYRDSDGDLFLTGRVKEIINVGGKKVSPQEVEDAIIALGIEDAICVGIDDPNGILGQVVKAFMIRGNSKLSVNEIKSLLGRTLESYKIPVEYEWVNFIQKTSSGKKLRTQMKINNKK